MESMIAMIARSLGFPSVNAVCREELPLHEETWTVPPKDSDLFMSMSDTYYGKLYATLTEGAPLAIHPDQVRRQIEVIEECHRQAPLPRLYE